MADNHRPRPQEIVHILLAVNVPDASALAFGDYDFVRDVAEATAGQNAARGLDELAVAFGDCGGWHGPFSI